MFAVDGRLSRLSLVDTVRWAYIEERNSDLDEWSILVKWFPKRVSTGSEGETGLAPLNWPKTFSACVGLSCPLCPAHVIPLLHGWSAQVH